MTAQFLSPEEGQRIRREFRIHASHYRKHYYLSAGAIEAKAQVSGSYQCPLCKRWFIGRLEDIK